MSDLELIIPIALVVLVALAMGSGSGSSAPEEEEWEPHFIDDYGIPRPAHEGLHDETIQELASGSRTIQRFTDDLQMMSQAPQNGQKFLQLAQSALEEMIANKKRVDDTMYRADHEPNRETAEDLEKEMINFADEYLAGGNLVHMYQKLIDEISKKITDSFENPSERWSYSPEGESMTPWERKNLLSQVADMEDRYGAFAEELERTTRESQAVLKRVQLNVERSFENLSILGNETEDGYAPAEPYHEPVSDVPIYDDTNDFKPATNKAENQIVKGAFGDVELEESPMEEDHTSFNIQPRMPPDTNPPATPVKKHVESSPHLLKIYKTLSASPGENLKIHERLEELGDEMNKFNQSMEAPKDEFDDSVSQASVTLSEEMARWENYSQNSLQDDIEVHAYDLDVGDQAFKRLQAYLKMADNNGADPKPLQDAINQLQQTLSPDDIGALTRDIMQNQGATIARALNFNVRPPRKGRTRAESQASLTTILETPPRQTDKPDARQMGIDMANLNIAMQELSGRNVPTVPASAPPDNRKQPRPKLTAQTPSKKSGMPLTWLNAFRETVKKKGRQTYHATQQKNPDLIRRLIAELGASAPRGYKPGSWKKLMDTHEPIVSESGEVFTYTEALNDPYFTKFMKTMQGMRDQLDDLTV